MDHAFPILFMLDSVHEPMNAEAFTEEEIVENEGQLISEIRRHGFEVNMKECEL